MSTRYRALRAFSTLVMGAGIGAVAVGGMDLVREGLTGPIANIVPNLSLPPVIVLSGAAMVIGGTLLRRGLNRRASLPPREDGRTSALKGGS